MQMKVIAVNGRKYYNITNSNEKKIPGKVSAAACKQVVNGRLAKYTYKQTVERRKWLKMEQVEDEDEESSMRVIWSWVGWGWKPIIHRDCERSAVQEKERK